MRKKRTTISAKLTIRGLHWVKRAAYALSSPKQAARHEGASQWAIWQISDFPAIIFDTKKPQTDLTEWGWCDKLQTDSGESLGGR